MSGQELQQSRVLDLILRCVHAGGLLAGWLAGLAFCSRVCSKAKAASGDTGDVDFAFGIRAIRGLLLAGFVIQVFLIARKWLDPEGEVEACARLGGHRFGAFASLLGGMLLVSVLGGMLWTLDLPAKRRTQARYVLLSGLM
jgi:hypothetical protein